MAYGQASKKEQARLRRPTANITGDGIESLTTRQKYENLTAVIANLHVQAAALKGAKLRAQIFERADIIRQLEEFKAQCRKLKHALHLENEANVGDIMLRICKKKFSEDQWKQIVNEARGIRIKLLTELEELDI